LRVIHDERSNDLITGYRQTGGRGARALQGTGFHVRGLTRNPESERATALAHQARRRQGDLDDEATLRARGRRVGASCVQNTGERASSGRGAGSASRR